MYIELDFNDLIDILREHIEDQEECNPCSTKAFAKCIWNKYTKRPERLSERAPKGDAIV